MERNRDLRQISDAETIGEGTWYTGYFIGHTFHELKLCPRKWKNSVFQKKGFLDKIVFLWKTVFLGVGIFVCPVCVFLVLTGFPDPGNGFSDWGGGDDSPIEKSQHRVKRGREQEGNRGDWVDWIPDLLLGSP